jgi:IclR family transcriptional regulator, KDG regulon repressor
MGAVSGNRYTVSAVAKALQLLSALSVRDRQASLAELAARTGIPRATAFRLLATLEAEGFVVKEGGEYRPGFKCFIVGNVAAAGLDLRKEARAQLLALRDDTGETAQVAILESWQVVYLERVLSRQAVGYMTSRAGAILPAYCTGLGKALLAYRPEHEVVAWASSQTFKALTPNTITSVDRLLEDLQTIRDRGYAIDEQEREVGVRCIAAPIRDHEGDVVAAVSVAGPGDRMPRRLVGSELAERVLAAAAAISARLGYTPSAAEVLEPKVLRRAKLASLA